MKKINIIDISVIAIIIIMVIAVGNRFKKFNVANDETSTADTITYEILIKGIRNYSVDAFEIGDTLYDSQTNVSIGKIIEKNVETAIDYITLTNGKVVKGSIPDKYDLILKIETDGIINDTGFFANKTVELRVGSEKTVETLYAKSTGIIRQIFAE